MTNDNLTELVARIVAEVTAKEVPCASSACVSEGEVPDLSAVDFKTVLDVPNAADPEEYLRMKARTEARLGVWRAGPRYRTKTELRFRADHAAAMDAVFTDVPEELLGRMGLFTVTSKCGSKDEYLTRPDLGRQLDDETIKMLRDKCTMKPQVQVFVSDGLSSTAVAANLVDILPAIMQGLKMHQVQAGTPFFLKYGRVGAMDAVTEALQAEVTVVLLGERPGLASGESLSAYMTYGGYVGIPEANRTVVSNIHRGGTNPAEAGAHIADLAALMLRQKASGLDLKL